MDLDMEDLPEEEAGDGQTGEVSAPENQRAEEIKAAEAKDHLSDSQDNHPMLHEQGEANSPESRTRTGRTWEGPAKTFSDSEPMSTCSLP